MKTKVKRQTADRKMFSSAGIKCFLLILMAGVIVSGYAAAETLKLSEDHWTWEPGETATFTALFDASQTKGITLAAEVSIESDDKDETVGKVLLTHVNGKKIPAKEQTSQVTFDVPDDSDSVYFAGAWKIGEYFEGQYVHLHLKVMDQNGKVLAQTSLSKTNPYRQEHGNGDFANLFLIIRKATVAVWIAAGCIGLIVTAIWIRRRTVLKKEEKGSQQ